MNVSKKIKMLTLAGIAGIGLAGAAATSALADYTRCDADSDRCWRVHTGYYDYDREDYYRPYVSGYHYYRRDYDDYYTSRHWVCDVDGDNCHWAYYRY